MKRLPILLLLFLSLLVSGCGFIKDYSKKQIMSVENGMSPQQITTLLGVPDFRRFDDGIEEWEYQGYATIVVVSFEGGRVIGLDSFANVVPQAPAHPNPPTVIVESSHQSPMYNKGVMSSAEFDRFFQSLKNGFSSDYMKKIDEALVRTRFTSAQCRVLLGLFTFSNEQVSFLKTMYPYIVDKQHFSTVTDRLTYSFDKDKVNEFIDNYNRKR